MRKILLLILFIPSVSIAGMKTDLLTIENSSGYPLFLNNIATKSVGNKVNIPFGLMSTGFAGDALALFGNMEVTATDITFGSDSGDFVFYARHNGSLTEIARFKGSDLATSIAGNANINGVNYTWPSGPPSTDGLCLSGTASNPVVLTWVSCSGGPTPPAAVNYALLEDSTFLLLEDSTKMLLEN